MTKAAYKGMDAISDFCVDKGHPKIEKFMIAGFSKRGWTTWLTVNKFLFTLFFSKFKLNL